MKQPTPHTLNPKSQILSPNPQTLNRPNLHYTLARGPTEEVDPARKREPLKELLSSPDCRNNLWLSPKPLNRGVYGRNSKP